jgi:hypothetical protein
MKKYDFDINTQEIFNQYYSIESLINWRDWLNIDSKQEFIESCLKNSGLSQIDNLFEMIKESITDSREFSVDINQYINSSKSNVPLIFCHTSGTTNNDPSALKWFHLSKSLIKQLWAPGMKAIFESSGLNSDSSAIIFVPSRMYFDGINEGARKKYISLYSSEFSQRLVISLFNPRTYVLYPYKDVYNLQVIYFILRLENISVVSAPAATLLKWADINRLKSGIKQYIAKVKENNKNFLRELELYKFIQANGIDSGVRKIQEKLSEKISQANLIFSISSLNEKKWSLIRSFMKWERGEEKFTNLYVGSEIGPFASSIPINSYDISRANKMYVFPLTLPVIQYKNKMKLITDINASQGRLLISRMNNSKPQINIDTGDIIAIKNQNKLPLIGGDIYRGEFTLKYEIYVNKKIKTPSKFIISAGNYFLFEDYDIKNAGDFLNSLQTDCSIKNDSLVLNKENNKNWQLYIPIDGEKCNSLKEMNQIIMNSPNEKSLKNALKNQIIELKILNEKLVDFLTPRSKILQKVREGKHPKGILKRWPLYVIKPKN